MMYGLGKMDCLQGEDEENCFELEINECIIGKEFRCRNGLCIPNEFVNDDDSDCLDGSDESQKNYKIECGNYFFQPSIICEEHFCGRYEFSCGDSNCLKNYPIRMNANLEICPNGRDKQFRRNQFLHNSNKSEASCWGYISHLIGLNVNFDIDEDFYVDDIYYDIFIDDRYRCPPIIVFPSYPIIFGHVRFIYYSNKTDWLTNASPNFICFNKKWCSSFKITKNFDDLTCIDYDDLPLNRTYRNWNTLMIAIENIFKECSHEALQKNDEQCHHSSLIPCENSSKCISKYRLIDGYKDCPNWSDEFSTKTCYLNLTHRFKCLLEDKCIPLNMIQDGKADCLDKSDEFIRQKTCQNSGKDICHPGKQTLHIPFGQICDGIVHLPKSSLNIENDETHCEQWPCETFYTNCNDVWNCPDGHDELKCLDLFQCPQGMFFCFDEDLTYSCTNNTSNCIGSSNDRNYCREKYPENFHLRYRCFNDTKCISPFQLCDCRIDCPLKHDDENLICQHESCQLNEYHCKNGKSATRCNFVAECRGKEDELLCDLIDIPKREKQFGIDEEYFNPYPSIEKNYSNDIIELKKNFKVLSLNDLSAVFFGWHCHRGVLIRSGDSYQCLCSPAYYGSRCEYESDRLSVILQLHTPSLINRHQIFQIVIFLLDINENILSYEIILYSDINYCLTKYLLYLLYPNQSKLPRNSFIRIDSFILTKEEEEIRYSQSWYFDIKFPFLPVNRIAARLTLSINTRTTVQCNELVCIHGQCMEYVNIRKIYCHCFHGWSGMSCDIPLNCQCSKGSFCISNQLCICPIGRIGPLCRVPYNICQTNSCRNNGTCVPLDARATAYDYDNVQQQYICLCPEEFAGKYCEKIVAKTHIQFSDISWSSPILIHSIKTSEDFSRAPRRRTIFRRIQSKNLTIYNPFVDTPEYQPNLVYIQFIDNNIVSRYYLVGILPRKFSEEVITSILPSNRCPHINELLNSTIVNFDRLRRIKFYQEICLNKHFFCFYDYDQMCLCNQFHHLDCFDFNHSLSICQQSLCENNGLCIQDEEICQSKSFCICQGCFYGSHCQLTTQKYVLSLDGIIGQYILRDVNLTEQPFIIQLSTIVISIMFFLGIVSNSFSIITFKQVKILDVGCRIYLLSSSIISLLLMIIFLVKLIYLLITQIMLSLNELGVYINCILIEFLIRIFPSIIDWLNACVAIERTVAVTFPGTFSRCKSVKIAKYVIIFNIMLNIVSSIHDPIHRRLITDEQDLRMWCTVSYQDKSWLNYYNSFINLIHFLIPFGINVISALILIRQTARSRSNIHQEISYQKHLKIQFKQFKHLLISPCILILLALPRLIISFVYSCMKQDRKVYLFLIAYWISFTPPLATFIIFVLPSETYKKDFRSAMHRLFSFN
ncbi:unnamed protein product [Adineta steineri]|uniref:Uncharacterized protein n=1 Tax=Adineta steineri TaxID=433720 RepID=A0A816BPL6_9BILA|nr:unnamed protein product [Adineta steineri]CAF1613454.1 unnamed protein product [Adineta steineri]